MWSLEELVGKGRYIPLSPNFQWRAQEVTRQAYNLEMIIFIGAWTGPARLPRTNDISWNGRYERSRNA